MYLIWRGFGWLVPVLAMGAFVGMQLGLNAALGENAYESSEWPKYASAVLGAVLVGVAGYLLNRKYRKTIVDEESGEEHKAPSHSFFFIPMEFWSVIVLGIFAFTTYQSSADTERLERILSEPRQGDIYLVDFTKIFTDSDQTYKYGAMKVIEVRDADIVLLPSEMGYDMKKGPRKDVREGTVEESSYFVEEPVLLPRSALSELRENGGIYNAGR